MSEKQGHTPGPWHVTVTDEYFEKYGCRRVIRVKAGDKHIRIGDTFDKTTIPDAALIAAAPDLLAALERIDADSRPGKYGPDIDVVSAMGAIARAAIAAARGE